MIRPRRVYPLASLSSSSSSSSSSPPSLSLASSRTSSSQHSSQAPPRLKRSHAEITRSTSRSPRPAKRHRTTPPSAFPVEPSVHEPGRAFVGHGSDSRARAAMAFVGRGGNTNNANSNANSSNNNHNTIDLTLDDDAPSPTSTLYSDLASSDLFESASPSPPPATGHHQSSRRGVGGPMAAAPPFGRGSIEVVDLIDDGDGETGPRPARATTATSVRPPSPEIEFVSERPAAAPLRQPTHGRTATGAAWMHPLLPDNAMARAIRDGAQQLLRNFQFPFMMPDAQGGGGGGGGAADDGDDLEIIDGDEYADLNLDYQQAAFAIGNVLDMDPRREPARQDYKAPASPKDGFIRSYEEESVLICPMCGDELAATADSDDDPKGQVWIVKACGHVYCGHCALNRPLPKSALKRDGRKNTRQEFRQCKVDGCHKVVTSKQSMVQIYL